MHDHLFSTKQAELQPSLLTVLASSQVSEPTLNPSPQIGVQTESGLFAGLEGQLYPNSIVHVELQPSLETEFPSSHCSVAVTSMPSPHVVTHTSAAVVDPPVQV